MNRNAVIAEALRGQVAPLPMGDRLELLYILAKQCCIAVVLSKEQRRLIAMRRLNRVAQLHAEAYAANALRRRRRIAKQHLDIMQRCDNRIQHLLGGSL